MVNKRKVTDKYERSKHRISLHFIAINSTPKSDTRRHHLRHIDFSFLHPTAIQHIPISVINLQLVNDNLSKFLASATALAAESVSSVEFDKSISTKFKQFEAKLDNPILVKDLDRERLIEQSEDFQATESELSKLSSTKGQSERSRWEIEGYRWNNLERRSERSGLRAMRWRLSIK